MKLNQNLKEIIFGGLLGDFNLQTYTKGSTWRLRILQSKRFEPYVTHLHSHFEPWVQSGVCYTTNKPHKVTGIAYDKCYFNTLTIPELAYFGHLFYNLELKEGSNYPKHLKKVPSKEVLDVWLTPRALAYWFMDDGSYKGSAVSARFCTDGFLYSEVEALQQVLTIKNNLKCTIIKDSSSWRIGISTKSMASFRDLVKPFMIPSMMYKLGL